MDPVTEIDVTLARPPCTSPLFWISAVHQKHENLSVHLLYAFRFSMMPAVLTHLSLSTTLSPQFLAISVTLDPAKKYARQL
jgi:hypothetical protein